MNRVSRFLDVPFLSVTPAFPILPTGFSDVTPIPTRDSPSAVKQKVFRAAGKDSGRMPDSTGAWRREKQLKGEFPKLRIDVNH